MSAVRTRLSDPEIRNHVSWARRARTAAGPAAIAVVVLAVFYPLLGMHSLLVTPEGPTNISDMLNASYPLRLLLGRALAAGHLPLWTDQILSGYPLLANPAVGTFYPVNWVFAILPGPAAMSVVVLLPCLLAGWFTFFFCRTLGLHRVPATLGGLSFAVCGLLVSHAKHSALIASAAWFPLLLALTERAVCSRGRTGWRAAWWLAPAVAMQLLAGGVQIAYISLLATAVYAVIGLDSRVRGEWRWRLLRLAAVALAVVCGVTLAAVQLLPARELAGLSERAGGMTLRQAEMIPMPAEDLLTLVSARVVGRASDYSYYRRAAKPGLFWEDYIYVGWPVALLAVAGLPWTLPRWPQARSLLLLAFLGLLLALGERGGLFPVAFGRLPGLSLFRFPERFLLWTELGTVVLGAMSAQLALARLRGRTRTVASSALLLLTAADLVAAQAPQNVYYKAARWLRPPVTAARILAGPPARVAAVSTFVANAEYARKFRQGGWEAHLSDMCADRALLKPDSNLIWGLPMVTGYVELVPKWEAQVWSSQHSFSVLTDWNNHMIEPVVASGRPAPARPPRGYTGLLGAANARYLVSRWPLEDARLQEIYTSGTAYLYRNLDTLGRAYLVSEATVIDTDERFRDVLSSGQADFRRQVYLNAGKPPAGQAASASVSFAARPVPVSTASTPTHVVLEPQAPGPCWLVLSDAYYPGWSVTVDGAPAPLLRANGTMRAVSLRAGKHQVVFTYRCRPLQLGALLMGGSALLWLAAGILLGCYRLPRNVGSA